MHSCIRFPDKPTTPGLQPTSLLARGWRITRYTLVVLATLFITACGSHSYRPGVYSPGNVYLDGHHSVHGIAVLGISSMAGSIRDFRQSSYIHDLEAMIRHYQPSLAVLSYDTLMDQIGHTEFYKILKRDYERYGYLNRESLEMLVAANLPVSQVLLVRIDRDDTEQAVPIRREARDQNGYLVQDRSEVVLRHYRTIVATAQIYGADSGQLVRESSYISTPYYERAYEDYTGSSFFGSVANSVRNAFVNGHSSDKYPPAPASLETTRGILRRVAQEINVR